jgi:hypothetical protein
MGHTQGRHAHAERPFAPCLNMAIAMARHVWPARPRAAGHTVNPWAWVWLDALTVETPRAMLRERLLLERTKSQLPAPTAAAAFAVRCHLINQATMDRTMLTIANAVACGQSIRFAPLSVRLISRPQCA